MLQHTLDAIAFPHGVVDIAVEERLGGVTRAVIAQSPPAQPISHTHVRRQHHSQENFS